MKRFKKNEWNIICWTDAIQLIKENTGFNLEDWIDKNIDIWSELCEYQDELVKLRYDKHNWKF